ncbi:MAG: hypothetical protein WB816_07770 [Methylocystis sp.]
MSKLQHKVWERPRGDAGLALAPFCQDSAQMSGGILSLPRPGLRFGAAGGRKKRDGAPQVFETARKFDAARRQA